MTTIAYKDGMIAYDSRHTDGNTIVSDDCDKRFERGGVSFFPCGHYADIPLLMSCWFDSDMKVSKDASVGAFVTEKGKVWRAGIHEGIFWKQAHEGDYAIGSGADHALTAMDMGASAKDAVKMAAKRDTGTGGKIRVFKIK